MKLLAALIVGSAVLVAAPADEKGKKCPLSGKDGKDDIFLNVNGKKIHFCCNNCPKAYKKKIGLVVDDSSKKCPISGKDASGKNTVIVKTAEKVAFCCNNCPKAFAKKNKFEVKESKPGKCPVSGNPAKDADGTSLTINGNKVFFCCKNCPKGYAKKLGVKDNSEKCPLSGKPTKAETEQIVVKSKLVGFCCGNCEKKYIKTNFGKKKVKL